MKLSTHGRRISGVEILDITPHGIWLSVKATEYFLPYQNYPWFKAAKVSDILQVKFLHDEHLHWPALDIDLHVDSLKHPDRYPLVYRTA
ncbi:MAG: DUF2442 domain-containing protein [Candidatus Omnitrophica bacterium]|nr:DUF2442 domain-containing protein [Candidatus Omnitrophota bacterium]